MTQFDDSIWQTWATSVITLVLDDGRRLAAGHDPMPWEGPIHVITAWNPGETRPPDQNTTANDTLRASLEERGHPHCIATGSSPDGSWSEDGFAVATMTRAEAVELARTFGQVAIYEIDDTEVVIIGCSDGSTLPAHPPEPGISPEV